MLSILLALSSHFFLILIKSPQLSAAPALWLQRLPFLTGEKKKQIIMVCLCSRSQRNVQSNADIFSLSLSVLYMHYRLYLWSGPNKCLTFWHRHRHSHFFFRYIDAQQNMSKCADLLMRLCCAEPEQQATNQAPVWYRALVFLWFDWLTVSTVFSGEQGQRLAKD